MFETGLTNDFLNHLIAQNTIFIQEDPVRVLNNDAALVIFEDLAEI